MKRIRGIILALLSSGTFGLIPLFSIPLLASGLSEPSILFHRFFFSALMMFIVCVARRESLRVDPKHLLSIILLSISYAGTSFLLLYSYEYISSGLATTIHFLYPIMVSIIMVALFKEKGSFVIFLTAVMSLIGVYLMSRTGTTGSLPLKGIGIAMLTILTYSTYIVGVNKTKAGQAIKAEPFTFYVLLCGAIFFGIFALASGGIQPIPSGNALINLLLLAGICTVISDLTLVLAIKDIGSTITSILGSMEPLVAVLVGIFHFNEAFSLSSGLGIALILIAVTIVIIKSSHTPAPQPASESAG